MPKMPKRLVSLVSFGISVLFALLIVWGAFNMIEREPLLQDFHIELRMGLGYGSISGEMDARAIDFESSGDGNFMALYLSPSNDTFNGLRAFRELGNFTVIVQDSGDYWVEHFYANGSSLEFLCIFDCEIEEIHLSDVNGSLITSNNYAHYNVAFKMMEDSIVPLIEVREMSWHPLLHPYVHVQANGNGSRLRVEGNALNLSVDGVNHTFTGRTFVTLRYFDDIEMDWYSSASFQCPLFPGTKAIIWEPDSFRLEDLTGFVESFGSAALVDDAIEGDEFRWINFWAMMWERPWDEWVFVDLLYGILKVDPQDGQKYSLNTITRTNPSGMFSSEEQQTTFFLVLGGLTLLPNGISLLGAKDDSKMKGRKRRGIRGVYLGRWRFHYRRPRVLRRERR